MQFGRETIELKKIFAGLAPGFGLNHARIFSASLPNEVKTANQLIEETGINQATVYTVLRDLQKWELISCSNTNPASYYISDALKSFEKQVKKLERELETKRKQFQELLLQKDGNEQGFLLKIIPGPQTKLMDMTAKRHIKYKEEINKLITEFQQIAKTAPEREKQLACSYYK